MNEPSPHEFDRHADRYEADMRQSIAAALADDQYFAEYKIRYVARRMQDNAPSRLLDFGCGIGRSLSLFHLQFPGAELWGYDVSPKSIEFARQRRAMAHLTSNLADLPLAEFDLIFAANVFHHIARSKRGEVLARCRDLLRNGGRIFVFEHNPFNPVTRLVFERCPFDKGASMLRRREVLLLAKEVGLNVLHSGYTLFFPRQVAVLRPLERMLEWLPLGAQYCVEMAK